MINWLKIKMWNYSKLRHFWTYEKEKSISVLEVTMHIIITTKCMMKILCDTAGDIITYLQATLKHRSNDI